jgi:transmembrane sensor
MASIPIKPSATQYEQASQWVSLLHDGDCPPEKYSDFQAWLTKSPLHQQAYQEVEAFWQQMGNLENFAKPQLESARNYVRYAQTKQSWHPRQSLALAASVLLATIAFPLIQLCLDNGNYRTAKGEQAHILLNDGSRIDLNTDTKVNVSYTFFNRKVTLEQGEALFTIKHDADKPFEVAAAGGVIRDIGTQFNVYKQGKKVAVTVLEGEVSVTQRQANPLQMLTAGMQLTYSQDGQNLLVSNSDLDDITAWRKGNLVFKGQRLEVVLQQLSRYHNVKLSTENVKLAALKVSGSFPTGDLNLSLKTIAASLPITITHPKTGQIMLMHRGR